MTSRGRFAMPIVAFTLAVVLAMVASACATPVAPVPQSALNPLTTPVPTVTPAPEPTPTPAVEPVATPASDSGVFEVAPIPTPIPEPGLTLTNMRIGVIADLGSAGVADNLALGAYEGARAWADSVNRSGGLAGRNVELILAESNLFGHQEAVEWMCSNDIFALVGSKALWDGDGVDLLTSSACGLPDFPAEVSTSPRRASPLTILSNSYLNPFYQAGPLRWLAEQFPESAEASSVLVLSHTPTRVESERMREAAEQSGFTFVYEASVPLQEDYSVHIEAMAELEVASLVWTGDPDRLLQLLGAKTQSIGRAFDFVLCSSDCYSDDFIQGANGLAEGVSAAIPHLPFSEPSESPELVNYMYAMATANEGFRPSTQGVDAWAAGLLFEEAVRRAVGAGTPNYNAQALSRESLLAAADTIDDWDASGLYGPGSNPAGGIPSPCYVLMIVRDGAWVRQHPIAPGSMDCNPENRLPLVSTASLGLVETVGSASTGDDDVPAEDTGTLTTDPLEADDTAVN